MSIPPGVNGSIQPPRKGEIITADFLAGLSAGVGRLSQFPRASGANIVANGAGIFVQPLPPDDGILFWNATGNTVPAYGVCLTNGVQVNGSFTLVSVKQPDLYGCQSNFLVNGPDPVPPSSPGIAQRGPLFLALYDTAVQTVPVEGGFWGTRSGSFKLQPFTGGFAVHGAYDSTNKIAWCRSSPMDHFYGQNLTGSTITKGTTGLITIFAGTYGSEVTTGITQSARAKFGDIKTNAFVECFLIKQASENTPVWNAIQTDTCP